MYSFLGGPRSGFTRRLPPRNPPAPTQLLPGGQQKIKPLRPLTGLVSILDEVGAALGAAHRRQLVHRDIKPENIFLVTRESDEIAKVLDFGLAKFVPNSTEQPTADTAPGAVVGTLRYMSPEQRLGEAAHHAWDLWALAVVTYEMLTGAYPFEGVRQRNAPSASEARVMKWGNERTAHA